MMDAHRNFLLQWHGQRRSRKAIASTDLFRRVERALRDDDEDQYEKLELEIEGQPKIQVTEEPLTRVQQSILRSLDGRALKVDEMAAECKVDRSRLYGNRKTRKGGLHELRARGLVKHKNGVGYYRPDAPPDNKSTTK